MSTTTLGPVSVYLALALTGQVPDVGEDPRAAGAARLKFMKESVKSYTFTDGSDRDAKITLQPEPAFRLGKQGDGVVLEGAIFLWTDSVGRPEAAAQVFLNLKSRVPGGEWLHEFTSLSTGTFAARQGGKPRWMPLAPGVEFKPIPGAPTPAASAAQRLSQMRSLAGEFRAEDDFWVRGWTPLRLLPTPIARYGKPDGTPEDGALFAFVHGTDPETFLFIEVRAGSGGPEWQYALAPMTCWALKVEHKGKPVWELPQRNTGNPFRTFYSRSYQP